MSKRTAVCLFAGMGATAKGQQDLGLDPVAYELNPVAADTLRHHFGNLNVIEANVKDVDFETDLAWEDVAVVIGGPPCQPFSQATAGSADYDPRDCIPDFVRAVRDLQPDVFVMEEVKTLLWKKNRPYYDRVVADLEAAGYRVDFRVLDASEHGLPQARKRLFTVGVRNDLGRDVVWPEKTPGPTMAEALGWTAGEAFRRNQAAPEAARVNAHDTRWTWPLSRPSTTVVGSFRPDVQAAPGYRKAGDGPRQNTPGSVVITLEEALVLQGMPRDWYLAGNEAQKRLQVGNSCPPALTAAITAANLKEND